MITTNSFPNEVTSSEDSKIKVNSITKEDLEGEVKKNNLSNFSQDINGGNCQIHKFIIKGKLYFLYFYKE